MIKKKINIIAGLIIAAILTFTPCVLAKNVNHEPVNKSFEINTDTLSEIDKYQEEYFAIIKRNDVLLKYEDDKALNKDRKELKNLYKKVKKQITNKAYLKEYKIIEKRYSKCDEETTPDINEFMDKYYSEVDGLLNKVYKEVKSKISSEDFKKLTLSEREWLNKVQDYKKEYDSMEFGTIGTLIYYDYQINMRQFRTLLLMLYL